MQSALMSWPGEAPEERAIEGSFCKLYKHLINVLYT